MKKVLIKLVFLFIGILIGATGFYFYPFLISKIQFEKLNNESPKTGSQIISLGNGWQRYSNYTLGFSINLPEKSGVYLCLPDGKPGMAPVEVKEVNNKVVIGHNCDGKFKDSYGTWEISIYKDVETLDQLQNIFKENFYTTCEIEKLIPIGEGNFTVTNKYDGKDLNESKCYINWVAEFIYNPELKKVATWSMGQDTMFFDYPNKFDSSGQLINYDIQISKSFKFIK